MKLGEIAARLECQLEGPENLEITGVAGMDEATSGELTFLANPKYRSKIKTTQAAAIIASPMEDLKGRPALRSANPYLTFAKALEFFHPLYRPPTSIHPTAVIARTSNWAAILPSAPTWSWKKELRLGMTAC
jgi:UDP-3-O-[3-hydroxymyristoyl] glucosamine N-acyltransferase